MIHTKRNVTFEQRQEIFALHQELRKESLPSGFFLTKDYLWAQRYIYELHMELRKLVTL